ncbi:MAG: peptide chain release factor 2 [Candidatus Paceibacterota bacterium]
MFNLSEKRDKIEELQEKTQQPNFWDNRKRASEISQKLSNFKNKVETWEEINEEVKDLEEMIELSDEDMREELKNQVEELEEKIEKKETHLYLSGEYDSRSAVLSIQSGAGGQDAEDWAAMLLRMYQRYCEEKGFKTSILSQSYGDQGPEGRVGIKTVSMEIDGENAFGLLKRESGVHRLVRISPFSAQDLRHTSFARVEVIPVLPESAKDDLNVKDENLRVDTYRASGPGGQYVNRRESAVRITHEPTGVTVSCQNERSQGSNKEKAMEQLYSKLYQLKQQQREEKLSDLKREDSPEFGNQIRSYFLHPDQRVVDHRTDVETGDIESVLDGGLEQFIQAEVKLENND